MSVPNKELGHRQAGRQACPCGRGHKGKKVHEQITREGGQIVGEEGRLVGRPPKGGPEEGSIMEETTALKGNTRRRRSGRNLSAEEEVGE